jgi:hypothetical protein
MFLQSESKTPKIKTRTRIYKYDYENNKVDFSDNSYEELDFEKELDCQTGPAEFYMKDL